MLHEVTCPACLSGEWAAIRHFDAKAVLLPPAEPPTYDLHDANTGDLQTFVDGVEDKSLGTALAHQLIKCSKKITLEEAIEIQFKALTGNKICKTP